jgi:hypothetical protein
MIPRLEQSFLSKECRSRVTPQSFITRIVRDRLVGYLGSWPETGFWVACMFGRLGFFGNPRVPQ